MPRANLSDYPRIINQYIKEDKLSKLQDIMLWLSFPCRRKAVNYLYQGEKIAAPIESTPFYFCHLHWQRSKFRYKALFCDFITSSKVMQFPVVCRANMSHFNILCSNLDYLILIYKFPK